MSKSKIKRLYFDLETSKTLAEVWGTGKTYIRASQIVFDQQVISAHWSWEGEDEVHNIHWGLDKQCDKRVIKRLVKELDKAEEIVAHNGQKFDMKWVYARAMKHDIPMKPYYKLIDTLKMSRSKLKLPSHSLAEICKYFNLPHKLDSGGTETWTKVQFQKDKEALDHLLYYGDGDIISLKAVYHKFSQYFEPTTHYGVKMGLEKYSCPECGGLHINYRGQYVTKMGTISHYLRCGDKSCHKSFKVNNKTYQDWIKFKMIKGIK